MSWKTASEALLRATADAITTSLGDGRHGSLHERISRTMASYEGRDLWRATFDWRDALCSELIAHRSVIACDVAVIGGGPLSLQVSAAVRQRRPDASVLAINATCGSRTYENAGRAFALNTDNGSDVDRHPLPGVRLADLCSERFPPAIVLADAVRLSAVLSDFDVWSWARVTGLRGAPGSWHLGVLYGGRSFEVTAREVVIATGFAEPRRSAFTAELQHIALPHEVDQSPRHFTAETFLTHAGWGSIANAPLGRTAVLGAGPSALAALSVIFDGAPKTLSHIDASAMRRDAHVTWFLGSGELASVMGFQEAGPIDAILRERYRQLHTRLARAVSERQCTVVPHRRVREVCRAGSRFVIDDTSFDTVIDCTGYAPYQLDALLPGFDPAEVHVADEVGVARGCHLVGDAIMPLLPEDFAKGPLEQWAGAAARLGERLAAQLPERATPIAPVIWAPEHDDVRVTAPVLPYHATAAERAGARLALRSALAELPMIVRAANVAGNALHLSGATTLLTNALTPRSRSTLIQGDSNGLED